MKPIYICALYIEPYITDAICRGHIWRPIYRALYIEALYKGLVYIRALNIQPHIQVPHIQSPYIYGNGGTSEAVSQMATRRCQSGCKPTRPEACISHFNTLGSFLGTFRLPKPPRQGLHGRLPLPRTPSIVFHIECNKNLLWEPPRTRGVNTFFRNMYFCRERSGS